MATWKTMKRNIYGLVLHKCQECDAVKRRHKEKSFHPVVEQYGHDLYVHFHVVDMIKGTGFRACGQTEIL